MGLHMSHDGHNGVHVNKLEGQYISFSCRKRTEILDEYAQHMTTEDQY